MHFPNQRDQANPDWRHNNLMLLSGRGVWGFDRRPVEVGGGEACEGGPQQIKQPFCSLPVDLLPGVNT